MPRSTDDSFTSPKSDRQNDICREDFRLTAQQFVLFDVLPLLDVIEQFESRDASAEVLRLLSPLLREPALSARGRGSMDEAVRVIARHARVHRRDIEIARAATDALKRLAELQIMDDVTAGRLEYPDFGMAPIRRRS